MEKVSYILNNARTFKVGTHDIQVRQLPHLEIMAHAEQKVLSSFTDSIVRASKSVPEDSRPKFIFDGLRSMYAGETAKEGEEDKPSAMREATSTWLNSVGGMLSILHLAMSKIDPQITEEDVAHIFINNPTSIKEVSGFVVGNTPRPFPVQGQTTTPTKTV